MNTPKEFEDNLLKEKKIRFLYAVEKAANFLGVDPPEVKFWETECPYTTSKEWAHIHTEQNLICVSKFRLREMSYDKIEDTATHEVTHLINFSHDRSFHNLHNKTRVDIWKPPLGTLIYVGGKYKEKKGKKSKIKSDKIRCNYHLCRKKVKLFRCQYCKKYFCQKHSDPKLPYIPNFEGKNIDSMEDWRKEDGHPCISYLKYQELKNKKKRKAYRKWLGKILKKDSNKEEYNKKNIDSTEDWKNKKEYEKNNNFKKDKSKSVLNFLIFIATLILIFVGIFYFREDILNIIENIKNTGTTMNYEPLNEWFESSYSCEDAPVNSRLYICEKLCKEQKGKFLDSRCMGDEKLYCKC